MSKTLKLKKGISCSEKVTSTTSAETLESLIYQKMPKHFSDKEKCTFPQSQQDQVITIINELPEIKFFFSKGIQFKSCSIQTYSQALMKNS